MSSKVRKRIGRKEIRKEVRDRELFVVEQGLPENMIIDPIVGEAIDVQSLGNGHIACPECNSPFFFVHTDPTNRRVSIGCSTCSYEQNLVFPWKVDLGGLGKGLFGCRRHLGAAMALIKKDETFCIGCRFCSTEIRIDVDPGLLIQ